MDFFPDVETLASYVLTYGPVALFAFLMLGIIALPVPEEALMVLGGVLMRKGNLPIPDMFFAALAGSICGITVSYLLGKLASDFFIHKFGPWVGLKQKYIDRAHNWFERFGTWTVFIGYFIPGVRHFSGFVAGMTELEYKKFALFAYSGALLWVTTFLSLGYFFGNKFPDVF
ncbi:MAG: DedA family protein [Chlamydiales bacterium]|nr:DedA family protein [Chlamydiales bacterium]